MFDYYSKLALEDIHKNNNKATFVIKPTDSDIKNHIVNWYGKDTNNSVKLVIKYIKRRKEAISQISNLSTSIEKNKVKIKWENPKDDAFVGTYIVRNRFHTPKNPFDGVKIYAGNDNYTYDDFGNTKISKYYAAFTYDNVPNYSEAVVSMYKI